MQYNHHFIFMKIRLSLLGNFLFLQSNINYMDLFRKIETDCCSEFFYRSFENLFRSVLLVAFITLASSCGFGQPDYRYEADSFLASMPDGLQDRQCTAIRKAVDSSSVDILSCLKARRFLDTNEDAYADVGLAPLSYSAMPCRRILFAAKQSLSWTAPHTGQVQTLSDSFSSLLT